MARARIGDIRSRRKFLWRSITLDTDNSTWWLQTVILHEWYAGGGPFNDRLSGWRVFAVEHEASGRISTCALLELDSLNTQLISKWLEMFERRNQWFTAAVVHMSKTFKAVGLDK